MDATLRVIVRALQGFTDKILQAQLRIHELSQAFVRA